MDTSSHSQLPDLFWPGVGRAGEHFTSQAFLEAMVQVETSWLFTLGHLGLAPTIATEVDFAVTWSDFERAAEAGGNPVIPLVAALRASEEARNPELARWIHRGLTSQDVLDTALMLMARSASAALRSQLRAQIDVLAAAAARHRTTVMTGRTLTQPAVPITFGLKAAQWLSGILDAYDDVARLDFPAQLGGAAGTLAAWVELDLPDPSGLAAAVAASLELSPAIPWHTNRAPITRIGDALVRCTDAWGRLANDVLTLARPEIGEVAEGAGGGSSTMPHKANPAMAVLIKRTALANPQLAATLHVAAAAANDERPDGAWHAEWATLRDLVRRTLAAARETTDLVTGLSVDKERMAANLAAVPEVLAEQESMAAVVGREPRDAYLGVSDAIIDKVLDRADRVTS